MSMFLFWGHIAATYSTVAKNHGTAIQWAKSVNQSVGVRFC